MLIISPTTLDIIITKFLDQTSRTHTGSEEEGTSHSGSQWSLSFPFDHACSIHTKMHVYLASSIVFQKMKQRALCLSSKHHRKHWKSLKLKTGLSNAQSQLLLSRSWLLPTKQWIHMNPGFSGNGISSGKYLKSSSVQAQMANNLHSLSHTNSVPTSQLPGEPMKPRQDVTGMNVAVSQ